jgi:hypothetical protein
MASHPVRVPEDVYDEAINAARLLGCTPGELFSRAWEAYRETPAFREDFSFFQKAFGAGDIEAVTGRLRERQAQRAKRRAAASRTRRGR